MGFECKSCNVEQPNVDSVPCEVRELRLPVLYSTDCPRCKVLEKKLGELGMLYEKRTDVDEMIQRGIHQAPMLDISGKLMDFNEAIAWLNSRKQEGANGNHTETV